MKLTYVSAAVETRAGSNRQGAKPSQHPSQGEGAADLASCSALFALLYGPSKGRSYINTPSFADVLQVGQLQHFIRAAVGLSLTSLRRPTVSTSELMFQRG